MGLIRDAIAWAKRSIVANLQSSGSFTYGDFFGAPNSASGVRVTARSALTYSPMWSGVDILSGDVSKLPFKTYERLTETTKRLAVGHPTFRILFQYTGEYASDQWLALMMSNAVMYGNGFSVIHRGPNRQPAWLEWIFAGQVDVERVEGRTIYRVTRNLWQARPDLPNYDIYDQADVFHVPGLMFDGPAGLSLVSFAKNTIGRMLGAEGYTDDFFRNGAQPYGALVHPDKLSDQARENLLRAIEDRHGGPGNKKRIALLQEGIQWKQMGVNPEDALLVENLNLGVKDVARFLKLPPHKLGDESKRGYNSIEMENKSYLDQTLMVWLSKFEHEANIKLFSRSEVEGYRYYTEFDTRRLLRADLKTRMEAGGVAITNGILNRNEVRELENLDPYEGGNEYLLPLNMQTASQAKEKPVDTDETPAEESEEEQDEQVRYELLESITSRLMTRIAKGVEQSEDPVRYIATLERYHGRVCRESLGPALRAVSRVDPEQWVVQLLDVARETYLDSAQHGEGLAQAEAKLNLLADDMVRSALEMEETLNA